MAVNTKRSKRKTKKKRVVLTPEQKKQKEVELKIKKEQRKYIAQIRNIFINSGFIRIITDGKNINYKGRSGEIDDIFLYENILVICEQTSAKSHSGDHLLKKNYLFNEILTTPSEFVEFINIEFEEFNKAKNPTYEFDHYKVKILYCSRYGVPDEHKNLLSNRIKFLDYPVLHYLLALTSTIKLSSRFEIFRFLGLEFSEIAENIISPNTGSRVEYKGSILPENHSSFGKGYKIISFYIDPEALIKRAYVLRKNGWMDGGILYQRVLLEKKVLEMRSYLRLEKRVFVNNIIATLSEKTSFIKDDHTIDVLNEKRTAPVTISLPNDFNSICIIDGQHRVYAYHERDDIYEKDIADLRIKQNLLLTAIYYPDGTSHEERAKFEAKLFLEINDKQSKAKSELKQDIEFILKPYSAIAISKDLISRLGIKGALANQIGEFSFDKDKLKTASIVTYGLKPLVKLFGNDSLYALWKDSNKSSLLTESDDTALSNYKNFCEQEINNLFIAFKRSVEKERWNTQQNGYIKIIVINGVIALLRKLIENNKTGDTEYYIKKLEKIKDFPFDSFKASRWNALGVKLYEEFFSR